MNLNWQCYILKVREPWVILENRQHFSFNSQVKRSRFDKILYIESLSTCDALHVIVVPLCLSLFKY